MPDLYKRGTLFCLIIFYATLAVAQDNTPAALLYTLRFESLTVEDGLPENNVVGVMQDHLGFIWMASHGGLVKYDGYTFTTYTHDPLDPGSISSTDVKCVYEDKSGTIWVGTWNGGLNRYDRTTDTFTHFRHDPDDPTSLSDDGIIQGELILEDSRGTLWIGTSNGLNRFDPESETFIRYYHDPDDPNSIRDNNITILYEAPSEPEILLVGTSRGLDRYDPESDSFSRFDAPAHDPDRWSGWIDEMLEDRDGVLWAGVAGNLNRFDHRTGTFTRYEPDPGDPRALSGPVTAILEDRDGVVWIGTNGNGLNRFDPDTETYTAYRHDPDDPGSIRGSNMRYSTSLFEDREGTIWISTWREQGMSLLRPGLATIAHYKRRPGQANSLSHDMVSAVHDDGKGFLWIGTFDGLNRLERVTGTYMAYRLNPENPRSLSPGNITSIYESSGEQGILWIINDDGGRPGIGGVLHRLDTATGLFTRYPTPSNSLNEINEDAQGMLWIGSRDGLFSFDRTTERLEHFPADPDNPNGLSSPVIWDLLIDREGMIWMATDEGVNRLDPETRIFARYQHDENDPTSISNNEARSVHEDQKGRLWVGTRGGLNYFDRDAGTFHVYTRHNSSLTNNVVYNIVEDEHGRLWFTHMGGTGITRFDPETETFDYYDAEQGLSVGAAWYLYKGSNGELFLSGTDGFNVFHPEQLENDSVAPLVVLTGIRLFDEPMAPGVDALLKAPTWEAEEIRLAHDQNDLTFEYAGLHFRNAARNTYRHIMEGFDRNWIEAGTQRTARYPGLPPGDYVFRVTAANPDGVWNEEGASIRVTVLPPWWQTTWAYLLYGLLGIIGVVVVDRIQRRRLIARERERARERELEQAREIEKAHVELQQAHQHLQATQAQLVQAEKMASLGELTAGIAHEIKNPLNFVNNFAEMVGELADELSDEVESTQDASGSENTHHFKEILSDLKLNAEQIAKHGKRADGIVSAMMQHASGGTGQRERVDLNQLVSEHIDLAYHGKRAQVPELDVQIEREMGGAVGEIEVVPQDIGRVLLNLLSNAFDAVHEKAQAVPDGYEPTVRVQTQRTIADGPSADAIAIRVSDNGSGIPEEIREKIFMPFFTTKPAGSGTGLGLSLSYDIITQGHGGTLTVKSETGKGTTFIVELPAMRADGT